jgi:cytochrome d ubiquinol oxidase subunit I
MDQVLLSRLQIAITFAYHFIFVPITLGSSLFLALLETRYVVTGDVLYKKMTKFWAKIFLINFSLGIVTGILQEFHLGMNWAEYSRFVGDIIGAPLALDSLLAFFLESTFIGIWIFGWDKLSKGLHLTTIWLVAIGTHLSGYFILIANSFMHNPIGYGIDADRLIMTDPGKMALNPYLWHQFPHVVSAGITTAGFLFLSFSAWHLLQNEGKNRDFFKRSFRWSASFAFIGAVLVGLIGHAQGQYLAKVQPLKVAAMEGHWETEQPGSFSVIAWIDQENQENPLDLTVPYALSFLLYNDFSSEVKGLIDLQDEAEARYGPGDYIPPVVLLYWSLRVMIGFGLVMILLSGLALYYSYRNSLARHTFLLRALVVTGMLPILSTTAGWLVAESGRWPWTVRGLQKVENAVSPNLSTGTILFTLISLTLLYGILTVIGIRLALTHGRKQPPSEENQGAT